RPTPLSPPFPYTTLFRSLGPSRAERPEPVQALFIEFDDGGAVTPRPDLPPNLSGSDPPPAIEQALLEDAPELVKKLLAGHGETADRKSTRLNSSHVKNSY